MSARLDQITRIGAVLALIATVATGAAAQERLTYAQMREEDLRAIVAYLRTLPPLPSGQ